MWLFSDLQYGFRSSRSSANPVTLVFDRIASAFDRSGLTRAAALDITRAFDRVWQAGLLYKLESCRISGQLFGCIPSFLWLASFGSGFYLVCFSEVNPV